MLKTVEITFTTFWYRPWLWNTGWPFWGVIVLHKHILFYKSFFFCCLIYWSLEGFFIAYLINVENLSLFGKSGHRFVINRSSLKPNGEKTLQPVPAFIKNIIISLDIYAQ